MHIYILNLHEYINLQEVYSEINERAVNDGKVERSTRRCKTMVFRPKFC